MRHHDDDIGVAGLARHSSRWPFGMIKYLSLKSGVMTVISSRRVNQHDAGIRVGWRRRASAMNEMASLWHFHCRMAMIGPCRLKMSDLRHFDEERADNQTLRQDADS